MKPTWENDDEFCIDVVLVESVVGFKVTTGFNDVEVVFLSELSRILRLLLAG